MQGDDGRKELHGHRECAERTLQAHPQQGHRGPPGAERRRLLSAITPGTPLLHPGRHSDHNDQHPHTRRQVTMDHLDPGLAVRHGAGRHGLLGGRNLGAGTHRAGAAITAGPVGTTQARIGQACEGAEQHQIKREEQREHRERLQAPHGRAATVARPHPDQRPQRDHQAEQHQLEHWGQVVQRLGIGHGLTGRPGSSHEEEARSRRSRSRLALAAPLVSMAAGKRIIQLPIGSTT